MQLPGNTSGAPVVQVPYDFMPGTKFAGLEFENELANLEALIRHINTLYDEIALLKKRLTAANIA